MIGHLRKTARLFHPQSHRAIILPLDHGVSDGLLPGLENPESLLKTLRELPVQGVVLHKGMAFLCNPEVRLDQTLIIHLSAGTRHGLPPYAKTQVCSVAEALRLGADMVSVHINIGNDLESRMLADLGKCVEEAHLSGLPLLAMIYARGGQIVQENDPALVAHCIRLGAELGADVIKVPYSGQQKSFGNAVQHCPVPVVVSGGPRAGTFSALLEETKEILDTGVAGLCFGRNIFQQEDPARAMRALCALVHPETKPED